MTPLKIIEEMHRHRWAMTKTSFDAMRAIIDGVEIDATEHAYFHALDKEQRLSTRSDIFGSRLESALYTSVRDNVGIILIDGPIIPRATWFSNVSGMVSLDVAADEFKRLEADKQIDTILHIYDTPGGAVSGISDYAAMVRASSKKTVSFGYMMASAGVWIGTASNEVYLSESGMAGSIGVVMSLVDSSEQDRKKGVRNLEVVSSQSPNKRPDKNTPEGMAVLQKEVDGLADVFVETVAMQTDVDVSTVLRDFGQGAMLVAREAASVGLIDGVADADSFITGLIHSRLTYSLPGITGNSEVNMPTDKDRQDLTADQLRETHPAAVMQIEQSARADGATDERKRISAIEALSAKFEASTPAIRNAAKAAVDKCRFAKKDDGSFMTVQDAQGAVLDAVANSNVTNLQALARPREAAAQFAEHAASATPAAVVPDPEAQAGKTRRANLLEAKARRMEGAK